MRLILILCAIVMFENCKSSKQIDGPQTGLSAPHVLIYKTKGNYDTKVPVTLSENKKTITSYPDPTDLLVNGQYCLPTKLKQGYYLDNKGIGLNIAFINMEYSYYSKLVKPPKIEELMRMIVDSDPLTELYDCGLRSKFKNIEQELNRKIKKNQLIDFKRIK
jgi:hypothetical protein